MLKPTPLLSLALLLLATPGASGGQTATSPRGDDRGDADKFVAPDALKARIRGLKEVRSVGGQSLADLHLEFVEPHRDRETGFVVGGTNSTETILSLKLINGIDIGALERQMRPGAPGHTGSDAGFLGHDESLLEVMAEDNRFVVERLGLAHQDLARPLLLLGHFARRQTRPRTVKLGDMKFKVSAIHYNGSQYSPFEDHTSASTDVTVINMRTGHGLTYSPLVPLMIERYGFYEGKGTSYRVDPRSILDLLRTEKSPTAGRYRRLPVQPTTDGELKQALALADPAALVELDLRRGRITDSGIARLPELVGLERLELAGAGISDGGLAGISALTHLKELSLRGTKVTDKTLAEIAGLSDLVRLELRSTEISDAGLKHLAGLTKLTTLELSGNDITDAGLAELSALTALQGLGLDGTKVTDEGLKALLPLKSLVELGLLNAEEITDKGLLMLSDLPALKTVHTYGTKVTKGGSREFNRRLGERSSAGGTDIRRVPGL